MGLCRVIQNIRTYPYNENKNLTDNQMLLLQKFMFISVKRTGGAEFQNFFMLAPPYGGVH